MVNAARGEVGLKVGGRTYRLCLTLGALAEIEAALGCRSLSDLAGRMERLSPADMLCVLAALLRGGGETELSERLSEAEISPAAAAHAIAEAFTRAMEG